MAVQLSPETQAILQTLKDEGQLIRNRGTNSVRSVNLKLEKFDSLFTSINSTIIEQTDIMKAQLDMAQDTLQKRRTEEQFDEVSGSGSTSGSDSSPGSGDSGSTSKTNEAINKMGDKIAEGFSIKNLAMAAAAGFVGYNFIKGFIDQAMQDNLFGMNDFVTKIKNIDIEKMQNDIKKMSDNIGKATDKFLELANKITDLIDNPLALLGVALLSLPGKIRLLSAAFNLTATLLKFSAKGKTLKGAKGVAGLLAAGTSAAALKEFGYSDKEIKEGTKQYDADQAAKNTKNNPATNNAGMDTKGPSQPPTPTKSNFTVKDGVFMSKTDKPLSGAALDSSVLKYNAEIDAGTRTGPKLDIDDVKKRQAAFRKAQNAKTAAALDKSAMDKKGGGGGIDFGRGTGTKGGKLGKEIVKKNKAKIAKLVGQQLVKVGLKGVPFLGAALGVAFAGWSLIRGDYTTASLEGSSIFLPSISGTAVDIGAVATAVFFNLMGLPYNPANEDHNEIMKELGAEVKKQVEEALSSGEGSDNETEATGAFAGYDQMSQEDYIKQYADPGYVQKYLDGFDPSTGKYAQGKGPGSGAMQGNKPGTGVYRLPPQTLQALNPEFGQGITPEMASDISAYLNTVEGAGSGSAAPVVIAPSTTNAPVQVTQGGNSAKQTTVQVMGGSGGESEGFGMTSGLVHQ